MSQRKKITKSDIEDLQPNTEIWDKAVAGFGARRQKGESVAYVVLYRTPEGRSRRFTIGRHGAPWTPDMARDEAKRVLVEVTKGKDPAAEKRARRAALTVAELCDQYLADVEAGRVLTRAGRSKKVSTLVSDKSRIEGHVKPLLGRLPVAAVTTQDVRDFMHAVAEGDTASRRKTNKTRGLSVLKGGQGTANRAVGVLGAIFTYAVERKMRADNPVRGVRRPADGKRLRRLSDAEYPALGTALRQASEQKISPMAVAVVRFLALTGWRSSEALELKWAYVDLPRRTATLPYSQTNKSSKTGESVRPLSHAACDVLRSVDRVGDLVFPSILTGGIMGGFRKFWNRIAKLGELPADITPHTLRHSFGSLAGDLGYSELTIAALIGHKSGTITSRYVHAADAVLLAAADAVAGETARRMGEAPPGGKVVELRQGVGR